MNLLITGANGQLGSELRRTIGNEVGELKNIEEVFYTDVQELDITDAEAIQAFVREHGIKCTINCAAFTAVDRAEQEPELCRRLNAEAPGYLARAMAEVGGTMLHISTDYVFDGTGHRPYREDDEAKPLGVYGSTKFEGEQAVRQILPESHIILRTAWLYSSFGNNFVKTMLRLGREREELRVVADQVGTPTYAADLAAQIVSIFNASAFHAGTYHFSNQGVCSWYDFTAAIFSLAGINTCKLYPINSEEYPTPARRPHYSVLDKTKITHVYGANINWWRDSLVKCLEELNALGEQQ